MKSTCPHCGTTYRIDPRKVPSGGVQARCSRCRGVFRVGEPATPSSAASTAPAAPEAPRPAPAPPPAPRESAQDDYDGQVHLPELGGSERLSTPPPAAPEPAPRTLPSEPPAPASSPLPEIAARAPATPAAPEPRIDASRPRPAPSAPTPPPLFGRPDPHGKARRLARALISDIAVYNPERRERGLAEGTLRQEFREEIRKSWEEYVAQVGESIVRSTPYFREALNEILAGGRPLF